MKKQVAKNDFREELLPSNRKEVFFDILKLQKLNLLKIGLILFVFFIPLLVSYVFLDVSISTLYEQYKSERITFEPIVNTINIFNLINIPLWMLFSFALAGSFRIIRNLVWGEPIFFTVDFFEGIKLNWKYFMVVFFIFGLLIYISFLCVYSPYIEIIIGVFPAFLSILIMFPILLIMLGLFNTYNIGIRSCFYNAMLIYVKDLFKNILMTVIILAPFILIIIAGGLKFILLVAYIVLLLPAVVTIVILYLNYLFDKYINRKSYLEYVDKGIHRG